MKNSTPVSKKILIEALELSTEILKNIEMSELPIENIAFKVSRLARLLNDLPIQNIMKYEIEGYPVLVNGLPLDIYNLAVTAGREYETKDKIQTSSNYQQGKSVERFIYGTSIKQLEDTLKAAEIALVAAKDADVSISSSNPHQHVPCPTKNTAERAKIRSDIIITSGRLSSRRSFIYHYALTKYAELKYSGIADDIFTRIREKVDSFIGVSLPDSIKKFNAVYDNLLSDNSEDWSNAVHSCRRILQDLADVVFQPTEEPHIKNGKEIKLGKDNYINRIIAFVENSTDSGRFQHLVGSHIKFLGERLDSIFQAAQKGSHSNILEREEADRYVVYTYLVVGDILSLMMDKSADK